jgi:hypothetical protein
MHDEKTGLNTAAMGDPREALLATTEWIISSLERAYAANYPQLVDFSGELDTEGRVHRLCDQILLVLESMLGYTPQGSIVERVFRARAWLRDSYHRDDLDVDSLTDFERGLADNRTLIAAGVEVHEHIVDALEYVQPSYIPKGCSEIRLVEYAMILQDVCNRVEGGNIDSRYCPKGLVAKVLVGAPIDASDRFDQAGGTSRAVVGNLNNEIRRAFDELNTDLEVRIGQLAGG